MSSFAVFIFLLTITAFYVFLSIYILVYAISRRVPATARRKKTGQDETAAETRAGRWLW